jgi:hypothetical protein
MKWFIGIGAAIVAARLYFGNIGPIIDWGLQ